MPKPCIWLVDDMCSCACLLLPHMLTLCSLHIPASKNSTGHRSKTFDAAADGYGRGEGCVVFVLRRSADRNKSTDQQPLAVLRGELLDHAQLHHLHQSYKCAGAMRLLSTALQPP